MFNAGKTSYHDSSCLFYSNRDNKDDSQRIWLGNPINKQSYVPADLRDFPGLLTIPVERFWLYVNVAG